MTERNLFSISLWVLFVRVVEFHAISETGVCITRVRVCVLLDTRSLCVCAYVCACVWVCVYVYIA